MADLEIELNPADFLTIGTVGPKGQRVFYLQAASGDVLVSMVIEKEQARALGDAVEELLEDLDVRFPARESSVVTTSLELREPITPRFRVAQLGLGYDEDRDLVVLVAQSLNAGRMAQEEGEDDEETDEAEFEELEDLSQIEGLEEGMTSAIARIWCTREQLRALSQRASQSVAAGRPDPRQNGRLIYYWT